MGTQTPVGQKNLVVESTTDYNKFKFMGGNRRVDLNHVKKLEREMAYNPDMFQAQPILVNENFFIVDGQHRFHAARNLNLPVYYIVKPKLAVEAARHLNTTQRRWTLVDFAHSYAESGRMDYVSFLRRRAQYPSLTTTIVLAALGGVNDSRAEDIFRRGEFKIGDEDQGVETLKRLEEVQRLSKQKLNLPMARSLMKLWNDSDDFDFGKFLQKLSKAPQEFTVHTTMRNCLRSIEDVYNFQSKSRIRLYS